jgi:hypothetical protein
VIRRLIAGLIVVGLGVGVWALWPRGDSDTTPTTTPTAVVSTTTTTTTVVTSTSEANTTTTSEDSNVVTTVEEAEAILRELWFGWFEGIYNQDEDRIKQVVGTQAALDNARTQFSVMEFVRSPQLSDILPGGTEIMRSDSECLAIWTTLKLTGFRDGSSTGVHVLRFDNGRWVSVALWEFKEDRWEQDCDAELESLS